MKTHGERLAVVEERVDKVCKEVHGNGSDGLSKTVIRLQDAVNNLIPGIDNLRTVVSGLTKFQIETEHDIRISEKRDVNRKWLIGTAIALGGIIVALIGYIII